MVHLSQTEVAGTTAKMEVIVIHSEKSSVNMTTGLRGSRFFSALNSQETHVRIAMM